TMAAWPSAVCSSASGCSTAGSRSRTCPRTSPWSRTTELTCGSAAPPDQRTDRDVNLALRDIKHNVGRFLLTCLGLSLLLGIVLAMVGIYRGLIVESLGLLRAAKADVWIVEGGTRGPFAEASRLPAHPREIIAAQRGVAGAGARS